MSWNLGLRLYLEVNTLLALGWALSLGFRHYGSTSAALLSQWSRVLFLAALFLPFGAALWLLTFGNGLRFQIWSSASREELPSASPVVELMPVSGISERGRFWHPSEIILWAVRTLGFLWACSVLWGLIRLFADGLRCADFSETRSPFANWVGLEFR